MLYNYINDKKKKVYVAVDENGEWITEIKDYLDFCKNMRCLAHNTINAYCIELHRLMEWLKEKNISLNLVDVNIVLQYRDFLEDNKKLSISTINRNMSIITGFLSYSYIFRYNICTNISMNLKAMGREIKVNNNSKLKGIIDTQKEFSNLLRKKEPAKKEKEVLTTEEIKNIIEACSNNRDKLMIRILLETGIRIGELMGLTIDAINIDKSQITISNVELEEGNYELKTGAAVRDIDISRGLLNMIIGHIVDNSKDTDSNFIFTKLTGNCKGEPIDYYTIDAIFKKIKNKTKIYRLKPHLLRRTAITIWVSNGMAKEILHKRAGHKNWSTTNKYYIKPSLEQKAKSLEQVADIGLLYG